MAREYSFHRLARADLFGIYDYIEQRGGPIRAGDYLGRIEAACDRLSDFPEMGVPREDVGAGLRTWAFERRILIVYRVSEERLDILRVLYAGRDFRADAVPQ